jgi:Domain of unknown function (DUF6265)
MSFSRTLGAVLVVGALAIVPARGGEGAIGKLAWLAGTWKGQADGIEMEEHWTEPRGGLMLGMHRDLESNKAVFFEFLRIEARGDAVVYLASPRGAPAIAFPAVEIGESRVVFENKEHDFPQRILYWTTPDGALHARVEGPKGGKVASEEWTWKRAR